MTSKRHERTTARRCAVQLLYTSELQGKTPEAVLEEGLCLVDSDPLSDYVLQLVNGVEENRAVIDEQLRAVSENWKVERMPIVDRAILRLAVYEMVYEEDVPISVTINEAVELAKDFGGEDDSPRFVNGVLGHIARRLEGEAVETEAAAGEPEAVLPEKTEA